MKMLFQEWEHSKTRKTSSWKRPSIWKSSRERSLEPQEPGWNNSQEWPISDQNLGCQKVAWAICLSWALRERWNQVGQIGTDSSVQNKLTFNPSNRKKQKQLKSKNSTRNIVKSWERTYNLISKYIWLMWWSSFTFWMTKLWMTRERRFAKCWDSIVNNLWFNRIPASIVENRRTL